MTGRQDDRPDPSPDNGADLTTSRLDGMKIPARCPVVQQTRPVGPPFHRSEQRSAAKVEHRPVRFDAAAALEVMVPKDAHEFVDRALQRGGARRVVAIRLPALVLRRSNHVDSEQLHLLQIVMHVEFWPQHEHSGAVAQDLVARFGAAPAGKRRSVPSAISRVVSAAEFVEA